MGNLVGTIKRFLGNKNTVTILAILAGVIVLWYFYNYRVNQAITTIQVPYAVEKIDAGKKIEADNIGYKELTVSSTRDSDIIMDITAISDKYICVGNSVPANGFFYSSQICEQAENPNSIFDLIPDGYRLYNLTVNNEMTYANSIMPGDYIDLYLSTEDRDSNQIIYGKLIESIEVFKVTDASGKDVFWDSDAGDSAFLIFAVPDEYADLLEISEKLNIEISPVPRSASYTNNPGETQISSEYLYSYVMRQAATIIN